MKKTKTEQVTILDVILFFAMIVLLSALSSTIVFTLFKYTPIGIVNTINSSSYNEGYRAGEKNVRDFFLDFVERCYDAKIKNLKTDNWYYSITSKVDLRKITSVVLSCEDVLHNYRSDDFVIGPARSNDWVSVMKNK